MATASPIHAIDSGMMPARLPGETPRAISNTRKSVATVACKRGSRGGEHGEA